MYAGDGPTTNHKRLVERFAFLNNSLIISVSNSLLNYIERAISQKVVAHWSCDDPNNAENIFICYILISFMGFVMNFRVECGRMKWREASDVGR